MDDTTRESALSTAPPETRRIVKTHVFVRARWCVPELGDQSAMAVAVLQT